jgi:hypothetical protein
MDNCKYLMVVGLKMMRQFAMLMISSTNIRLGTIGLTLSSIKILESGGQLTVLDIHTLKSLLNIYWEWSFRGSRE